MAESCWPLFPSRSGAEGVNDNHPLPGILIDDRDFGFIPAPQNFAGVDRHVFRVAVGASNTVYENLKHSKQVCDSPWLMIFFSRRITYMSKTKLFNEAYRLAFKQLMADQELLAKPSGLATRLRDAVQALIKDSNSPSFIAVEAIARLKS